MHKKIYICAINEKDENERKELFNQLINGTIYVMLDHIKTNNIGVVSRTSEDNNDVVSSFVE